MDTVLPSTMESEHRPEIATCEHWHEADRRALEMTRLTVAKIDADPNLVQVGVEKMKQWRRQRDGYQPNCLDEWEEFIATEPWQKLRERLLEGSDEGQRLRSTHPFAGIISQEERESVYGFDFKRMKTEYEQRTGKPWPTSPDTLPGQRRSHAG